MFAQHELALCKIFFWLDKSKHNTYLIDKDATQNILKSKMNHQKFKLPSLPSLKTIKKHTNKKRKSVWRLQTLCSLIYAEISQTTFLFSLSRPQKM